MLEPSERPSEIVAAKLDKITELSPTDLDIAHEWLNNNADSSTAFLHLKDKLAWIFRLLERMHKETGPLKIVGLDTRFQHATTIVVLSNLMEMFNCTF
ncbi:hypothetical protein AAC387_Pa05g0612 [Persea americana]